MQHSEARSHQQRAGLGVSGGGADDDHNGGGGKAEGLVFVEGPDPRFESPAEGLGMEVVAEPFGVPRLRPKEEQQRGGGCPGDVRATTLSQAPTASGPLWRSL